MLIQYFYVFVSEKAKDPLEFSQKFKINVFFFHTCENLQ